MANNDSYGVNKNTSLTVTAPGVLGNDVDLDGNPMTAVLVATTAHGTLNLSTNGGFTYTPVSNYFGADSFTYQVNDGVTNSGVATVSLTITNTVTALADVAVFKTGPGQGVVGGNITFTITLTNLGPSTASNIVANDLLPAGFTFVTATPLPATVLSNLVTWSGFSLTNQGSTNFILTVTTTNIGTFTNIAFSTADTTDPVPTNNDGTGPASQAGITVSSQSFGIVAGTNVFNPQTGLFEQQAAVTNYSGATVAAVRLLVSGLRAGVTLYNASGTNAGVPYAQYNAPLNPSQGVVFVLEFYVPDRKPFTDTLAAEAVLPTPATTNLASGVLIDTYIFDQRIAGDPRFVIEFASIPGTTYTIIYSDDLQTWYVATPTITANANRTQWYDDGPPETQSKPVSSRSRYYRVIANP